MLMGVPRVWPSKTPDRICTVSDSLRGVTILDCPGRRRSRSGWISASDNLRRGGQPSTTTPTPPPCDSPQVVMRNSWPNEFAMEPVWGKRRARSNRPWKSQISNLKFEISAVLSRPAFLANQFFIRAHQLRHQSRLAQAVIIQVIDLDDAQTAEREKDAFSLKQFFANNS